MPRNETLITYLKTRRSIPAVQMKEPGPSRTEIEEILKLSSRVPDHGKLVPWRFIVITGDARKRMTAELAALAKADKPALSDELKIIEEARFLRAPTVIAVVSKAAPHFKVPEWEQVMSAGAVCLNMVIAANAVGYAANWLTEWMAFDERAHRIIGIEPGEKVAGFIHIGSTDFPVTDRPRPELADIVTWQD